MIVQLTDTELKHLENEVRWFKERMEDYRNSFFKVVDFTKELDSSNLCDYERLLGLIDTESERY